MKKRYLYIALLSEMTACIGAYVMQYFTTRKLGMLRWVNHLCNTWSKSISLDQLNLIMMLLVSVLTLALLFWTIKRARERIRTAAPLMAAAVGSVGVYLVWTLRHTRKTMAAYYLVSPILLLGAVIALICWARAVLKSE